MFDVENLDCMWPDDLVSYADDLDRQRPPIDHADHVHYLAVARYARLKSSAMREREAGNVQAALTQEAWCDRIYSQLPQWAKW